MPGISPQKIMASPLPRPRRYITTHDGQGKAVFDTSFYHEPPMAKTASSSSFVPFVSEGFPATFDNETDLNGYVSYLACAPGLVSRTGSVLRIVDLKPGSRSDMHRTVSLDYVVVLSGSVELELDGGEKKTLEQGDVVVQRGTMHSWTNVTPEGHWARVMFVIQPSTPVEVDGKWLGQEGKGV